MINLLFIFLLIKSYKEKIIMLSDIRKYQINNRWNNMILIQKNETNINRNITGLDYRFPLNKSIDDDELNKIIINFNKYKLLKTLEDNKLSDQYKINLLSNFTDKNYAMNITKGGLFNDW